MLKYENMGFYVYTRVLNLSPFLLFLFVIRICKLGMEKIHSLKFPVTYRVKISDRRDGYDLERKLIEQERYEKLIKLKLERKNGILKIL